MGEVLALALAIAASPFPVVPAILLLFTARPRPTSLAFLGGWFGGIGLVTAVFALLAEAIGSGGDSPAWLSWVRIVVGAVLVVVGVRQWVGRRAADGPPAWMRSIQDATPRTAVRLALLLSVANPKVVLLAAAAGLDLGTAGLSVAREIAAVVGFTAVASITVAIPVLLHAVLGARVLPPLRTAKDWLLRNNAAVMAVVITAIGLVLIKNGVTGL
ncbi:GAP family protein [Pengzhenrongella frigida]|uniref:GAP family protein n=1 Tax=Pengzhenrongella frigida TaxID=1259133 RepID=UPI0013ECCCDA|nr:GAP family protein [Cellulomonas sp. HLT2-17]